MLLLSDPPPRYFEVAQAAWMNVESQGVSRQLGAESPRN